MIRLLEQHVDTLRSFSKLDNENVKDNDSKGDSKLQGLLAELRNGME